MKWSAVRMRSSALNEEFSGEKPTSNKAFKKKGKVAEKAKFKLGGHGLPRFVH
jgi:hypothetical protein